MPQIIPQSEAGTLPPSNNMGGKSLFSPIPSHVAFVDQVSFTGKCAHVPGSWFTDRDFASLLSPILEEIFGFGVTADRERGMNFYKSSFVLGDSWGFVSTGGQRDTFLVQITGAGALASRGGWEKRLHDWLSSIPSACITRLDLAHDDYSGESYSPTQALDDYISGKFSNGGHPPSCEQRGNWIRPDGSGLTFYVGKRQNGKLLRVYEKGKQLGGASCHFPDWVRTELELHNEGRSIPFDALINPGPYLAGAYPALAWISEKSCRIATKQKIIEVTLDKCEAMVKHMVGRHITALLLHYGSAQVVIDKIKRQGLPPGLTMPDWIESPLPIRPSPRISPEHAFDLAFSY